MDLDVLEHQVERFVSQTDLTPVLNWSSLAPWRLEPLAQGEYNVNYLLRQAEHRWVVRVNIGTQIARDDQILYEYRALALLAPSGVTPVPYLVDDERAWVPHGVLLMEHIPGEPLDYTTDLETAARLFARIHEQPVAAGENHLILEELPLTQTYEECARLLAAYRASPRAVPEVRGYLDEVEAWAREACAGDRYFEADPQRCVINTEVNSGNFIANRDRGSLHLVDWEKPLWGDPSQDLSHFSVPTTTLWKTDVRLTPAERRRFLDGYRAAIADRHLADTIEERVRLRDPFNCLRGIAWSAMAWAAYQSGEHALTNADTFRTMSRYLKLPFLRTLFDAHLTPSRSTT